MTAERKLPRGWIESSLEEVADVIRGITFPASAKSASPEAHTVVCLRTSNVQRILEFDDVLHVPASYVKRDDQWLRAGDTVISMANSYELVGKVAFATHVPLRTTIGGFISIIRPKLLDPRFAYYQLASARVQQALRSTASQTVNISNLSLRAIYPTRFLVPPLTEQGRIAEVIESYFTRLDDAAATLERVQRNLKRYRASVLKAAVEGRLVPTEAELARAEGRDYEPASVLLEGILAERRRSDQAFEDLPPLPTGWAWSTLGELANVKGGITKGEKRKPSVTYREVPYLRVANVQRGYLDLRVIKMISASEETITELRLQPGDVLFNEGGDRDKLGRGWVWKGEISECIHQNHVFRARVIGDAIVPQFLSWYANTEGQRYFFVEGKHTTNLASINITKLRALPVPVPPRSEQLRIVQAVEESLSLIDSALASAEREPVRCARLRQSILKLAFKGDLVDQDSSDEPASVLLERIKAERSASATAKKSNNPRRSTNA